MERADHTERLPVARRRLLGGAVGAGLALVLAGCDKAANFLNTPNWRQLTGAELRAMGNVIWQPFEGDPEARGHDLRRWGRVAFLQTPEQEARPQLGALFRDPGNNVHLAGLQQSLVGRPSPKHVGTGFKIGPQDTAFSLVNLASLHGAETMRALPHVTTVGGYGRYYPINELPGELATVPILGN